MISNDGAVIPFIFVHINKTGGSSMERTFMPFGSSKNCGERIFNTSIPFKHTQHWKILEYQQFLGSIKEYFSFTFVRNPWDRMVSLFSWNEGEGRENQGIKEFNDWIFTLDDFGSYNYCEHKTCDHSRIVENCVDWICNKNGNIAVDFIGRFENIEKDYKIVRKILCVPITRKLYSKEKPRSKQSEHEHYSKYYGDESKREVEKRFYKDIEMFGYTFNGV